MILRGHRPFRLSRIGIALIAVVFAATLPAWTLRATPERAPSSSATSQQAVPPPAGAVQIEFRDVQLPTGQFQVRQAQVVATRIELSAQTGEVLFMTTPDRTFTHELMAYRGLVGQTIHLHLRGDMGGKVWGTDIYTDDSDPNAAAVHDGILKPDEEGIAAIRLLPGIERYDGTPRNGVQSDDFGHFGGSYRFEGVQPVAKLEPFEISRRPNIPFILVMSGLGGDSASNELIRMRDQIGATVDLTVTGSINASIWGDGVYTDDSAVAVAAVHAGLLRVGETGVVRATIMGPQDRYESTIRNGVQSQSFGRYDGGYRLSK